MLVAGVVITAAGATEEPVAEPTDAEAAEAEKETEAKAE